MGNNFIISLGSDLLLLTEDQFKVAVSEGKKIMGAETGDSKSERLEKLLDAEEMKEKTGVPSTWFLEAARQNKIPSLRMGKYVRFKLSEVLYAIDRKSLRKRGKF